MQARAHQSRQSGASHPDTVVFDGVAWLQQQLDAQTKSPPRDKAKAKDKDNKDKDEDEEGRMQEAVLKRVRVWSGGLVHGIQCVYELRGALTVPSPRPCSSLTT